MIDVRNIRYTLILLKEDGERLDLTSIVEDLEYEEGENQWAQQASFFIPNVKYQGTYISSLAKLNCMVFIFASDGVTEDEVFRGTITDWEVAKRAEEHGFTVYAYDNLYFMQKNQDNRYFSEGTGTKAAITSILSSWNIPLGEYSGPDVKHAKTLFKDYYLSKMVKELLDDAYKKGAKKCCIKSVKGKLYFVARGGNPIVYMLEENQNVEVSSDSFDMKNLVTRVKIVGKEDKEGRQPIEAVLDGDLSFGVHQRIMNRSEDDSLDEAKSAARDVLDEYGKPERVSKVESPDIPHLRRWDRIYISAGTLNGYYWVSSVTHKCDSASMKIRVVPEGMESNDDLASVLGNAINSTKKSELLIDFGSIQGDYSLRTNTYPDPIPKGDYSVLRQLTLGETNTYLTVTACDGMHMHGPSGPHGHGHFAPSGMNGEGGGPPAPIANPPETSKNTLISPAVQKQFDKMSEAAAEQGETFGWADFQKEFPKLLDPQVIPEDPGVVYPTGTGSPPHLHPKDDEGSKHRHPADSRETHTHVTSPESNHVHVVLIPELMRWLHPGDRVLVAWVQNEAVVLDIVRRASVIG